MRSICATLVFIFGLNIIWHSTGYFFQPETNGAVNALFWFAVTLLSGVAIASFSRRIAAWITASFDEPAVADAQISLTLIRLFGCYVLYQTAPTFAQWVIWFVTDGPTQSYPQQINEARIHGIFKVAVQLSVCLLAIWLALAPSKFLNWASRFDRVNANE